MTHTGSGANSAVMRCAKRCQTGATSPGTLSDQLLHGLHVSLGQTRRHGLDGFAFAIQQQAAHVDRTPMASLASPQRLQQVGQKLFQALLTFRDSPLGHGPSLTPLAREVNNLT